MTAAPEATPQAHRNGDSIPTAWVVWIDNDMGYGAPNWEVDNSGPTPMEPINSALEHAAKTLSMGYPTAILPVGCSPTNASRRDVDIYPESVKAVSRYIAGKLHGGTHCPGTGALGECPAMDRIGLHEGREIWEAYVYLWTEGDQVKASDLVAWFTACGCEVYGITADLYDPYNDVTNGSAPDGARPHCVRFSPPATPSVAASTSNPLE